MEIRREQCRSTTWTEALVTEGNLNSGEERMDQKGVVVRPIAMGEPVFLSRLSGEGGRASLSGVVAEKMRGVTIQVNDNFGVAGFVLPGDRVDILLLRELSEKNPVIDILQIGRAHV